MNYYIMVDPDKPNKCKVGITTDPAGRLRSYRTASPQCSYHALYRNVDNTRQHEKNILNILREGFSVDREYVHCPPSIVQNIVEAYFTDNNITVTSQIR